MISRPNLFRSTMQIEGLVFDRNDLDWDGISELWIGAESGSAKHVFNKIIARYEKSPQGRKFLETENCLPGVNYKDAQIYKEKNLPKLLKSMGESGFIKSSTYGSQIIKFEIFDQNLSGEVLINFDDLFLNGGRSSSLIVNKLRLGLNLIIEGVAGSGKSYILRDLCESGVYGKNGSRIEVVVFHPSTSYEEFVSGVRPNFNKRADESDFVTQEGTFVQMCNRAAQDPDNAYLLFIDEINRANTSRVFGDLMLVLEKSKRQDYAGLSLEGRDGALFEASVQEMPGDYVRLQTPIFKNGKEYNKLAVPTNLHVLGTMNTTDRSVGTIDLALRRRFHWVTQHPLTAEELQEAMKDADEDCPADIASWYENANLILLNQVGPDARLGHAYFFGKDGDEEAIAEALLNQLKEVAFTFNISQTILDEIGPVHGQKIFIRGAGLGARPDIVDES